MKRHRLPSAHRQIITPVSQVPGRRSMYHYPDLSSLLFFRQSYSSSFTFLSLPRIIPHCTDHHRRSVTGQLFKWSHSHIGSPNPTNRWTGPDLRLISDHGHGKFAFSPKKQNSIRVTVWLEISRVLYRGMAVWMCKCNMCRAQGGAFHLHNYRLQMRPFPSCASYTVRKVL